MFCCLLLVISSPRSTLDSLDTFLVGSNTFLPIFVLLRVLVLKPITHPSTLAKGTYHWKHGIWHQNHIIIYIYIYTYCHIFSYCQGHIFGHLNCLIWRTTTCQSTRARLSLKGHHALDERATCLHFCEWHVWSPSFILPMVGRLNWIEI